MARAPAQRSRRLRAWLWTGPPGHLLGGALDVAEALARHARRTRRARKRTTGARPAHTRAAGAGRTRR